MIKYFLINRNIIDSGMNPYNIDDLLNLKARYPIPGAKLEVKYSNNNSRCLVKLTIPRVSEGEIDLMPEMSTLTISSNVIPLKSENFIDLQNLPGLNLSGIPDISNDQSLRAIKQRIFNWFGLPIGSDW